MTPSSLDQPVKTKVLTSFESPGEKGGGAPLFYEKEEKGRRVRVVF